MRFLVLNLVLSTWLLLSAFVLPQSPLSSAFTAVTAFLVLLFAFLAAGKPASRYAITVLGALLGASAALVPGDSLATTVNNGIVGALLFALSLVRPTHAAPSEGPAAGSETTAAEPAKP